MDELMVTQLTNTLTNLGHTKYVSTSKDGLSKGYPYFSNTMSKVSLHSTMRTLDRILCFHYCHPWMTLDCSR